MHTKNAIASVALARGRAVILDANGKAAYPTETGGRVFGIVTEAGVINTPVSIYTIGDAPNAEVGGAVTKGDLLKATVTTGKLQKAAASALMDSANANADITFTAKRAYQGHIGEHISVTFTDPAGNNQPLTVTVTRLDINVLLKTGAAGAIESTAAEIVAAIAAHAAASLLVAGVAEGTGAGVVQAIAKTYLDGGRGGFAVALENATTDGALIAVDILGGAG